MKFKKKKLDLIYSDSRINYIYFDDNKYLIIVKYWSNMQEIQYNIQNIEVCWEALH